MHVYLPVNRGRECGGASVATMVRVSNETREAIRVLSAETGDSMHGVVHKAIEAYRRQLLLDRANEGFAALRKDPDAWREELEERGAWDVTLGDGLDED